MEPPSATGAAALEVARTCEIAELEVEPCKEPRRILLVPREGHRLSEQMQQVG